MDCPRVGKLFGGCSFSPRFDEGRVEYPPYEGAAGAIVLALEKAKPMTYVRDVCERCGKTVERSK